MPAIDQPTPLRIAGFGWRKDIPDQRDFRFSAPRAPGPLPTSADLRPKMPPVYDQGPLGACVANAIAAAVEYEMVQHGEPDFMPDRLLLYYECRRIEGTLRSDAGASIRDGMKVAAQVGICAETLWPYDPRRFAQRPPPPCYQDAARHRVSQYAAVAQTTPTVRAALAAGQPVVFGFSVYQSFESDAVAQTGNVPMPVPGEGLLGGHAVCAVGYDDSRGVLICRNSWGPSWGAAGYFYLPYAYAFNTQLAADFWVCLNI